MRSNKAHREPLRWVRAGEAREARELHRSQRDSAGLMAILQRYPLGNL